MRHFISRYSEMFLCCCLVSIASYARAQTDTPPKIPAIEATNYMGQDVIVTDKVAQVALRATVALLNLHQKYPGSPLTCVIRNQDTNNFPTIANYSGKLVEVSGRIISYQGRPEIILTLPEQIIVLGDAPTEEAPSSVTGGSKELSAAENNSIPGSLPANPEGQLERVTWWIAGSLGVIILLLGLLVLLFWRRSPSPESQQSSELALVRLPEANGDGGMDQWKQRALVAEAMAGKQGQLFREKMLPELTEFAKQSLVQGLYAQRKALLDAQEQAQRYLVELEGRLSALQLPLQERILAYERRVGELEKELATQTEGVRELTRAALGLVRRKLEEERELQRVAGPLN
jgi:hypothetical protein